ncbi:deaminase [Actinosynnema sp. ALI-1.44]|uniref:dihydrofolate reductase family protein n=1 Tax=Actinosynnema sp. ALI-1.44 TaxID=1933779 RepID=UPI00097C2C51|nr:dihydrofolate reductase family protein [Actinosynnema sp. ALI-1.44]ONI70803.1 deaminase [Actinosynnema sp. ALI-1.44]
MAKTLYSVSMSADGFIAGPGGDMSWLKDYLGPNPAVDDLVEQVGALLVGNRTFGGDDPNKGTESEGEAFGGGWSGPQFVLAHHPPPEPVPGVTFVHDIRTAVEVSKAAAGEKYVNVLGANVARGLLEIGELDEVLTMIAPVMLGDGVRVFDHPGGAHVRLERFSVSHAEHATNLWYRVLR